MSSFKEFYLNEKLGLFKAAMQKQLGLKHVAFNNYVDRQNNQWFWYEVEQKFKKILSVKEKDERYIKFIYDISNSDSRMKLFVNTYKKVYKYCSDDKKWFTLEPREMVFLKECQNFYESTENLESNIFRGMEIEGRLKKQYEKLYREKKTFLYKPLKSISSWSFSKNQADYFGDLILGANLKDAKKFIDVNIYMKFYDNIQNILEKIQTKTHDKIQYTLQSLAIEKDTDRKNLFVKKFEDFDYQKNPHPNEKEVIIIGNIPAKVVKID